MADPVLSRLVLAAAVVLSACRGDGVPAGSDESGSESTTAVTTIVPDDDGPASTTSSAEDTAADTGTPTDLPPPDLDPCERVDELLGELGRAADDEALTALTDAFFTEIAYSEHGLPILCEGRLVVLLVDDAGGSLSVTGDFDDWDPTAHPLAQPVAGFPLWVGDVALADPLPPSLYKFVRDGSEYFADPRARRFAWDEFGEYSLTDARPDASHHERWPAFAENVGALDPRDVVVFVPAGALAQSDLPVLYMHDGQNLFAPDAPFGGWRVGPTLDQAIADGLVPPMLVVGIGNTPARLDEYSHVEDDLGGGPIGGRADEYADFLVGGVKPFVDARYPTRTDAGATAVVGSSMGGLVSLYLAWRHPDVFGAAGSMSGTLGWGRMGADNDRVLELYEGMPPPPQTWLYLDSGGAGPCPDGTDNYCETIEMRDLLVALGWSEGDDLVWRWAEGASHDEAAWADRLPGFFADLGVWLGSSP